MYPQIPFVAAGAISPLKLPVPENCGLMEKEPSSRIYPDRPSNVTDDKPSWKSETSSNIVRIISLQV
jgi:hypothetical protein